MTSHLRPTEEMLNVFNLRRSLKVFASSHQRLQILRTLPHSDARLISLPRTLYILVSNFECIVYYVAVIPSYGAKLLEVLPSSGKSYRRTPSFSDADRVCHHVQDSSWNPPTRAHLRICISALLGDRPTEKPKRLLLLLATQNADKAPKPAALEQRLAMMKIFANELLQAVAQPDKNYDTDGLKEGEIVVDVGVTKEARFVDKTSVLEKYWDYTCLTSEDVRKPMEQVHLIGFDTLIRLLDIKYYPPNHDLQPLESLFEKHRVRVTRRTDDAWGGKEVQDEYIGKIQDGDREDEGAKREWSERIELVEGRKEGEEIVSSTKVREAAKAGDRKALQKLVSDGVAQWIMDEKLYLNDD